MSCPTASGTVSMWLLERSKAFSEDSRETEAGRVASLLPHTPRLVNELQGHAQTITTFSQGLAEAMR